MIPVVASISRLHRVPVPHTNEAVYALSGDGRRWVAKRESDMGFEALLAEALGWLLARAVGAPVPDAAICVSGAQRTWLSACVQGVLHWSASHAQRVANLESAGAVLTLDAWLMNEARHARNILVEPGSPSSVHLWAIDWDEALAGHVSDFVERGLLCPSVHNHARGLPVSGLAPGARRTAQRVAAWAPKELASRVSAACEVAREERVAELTTAPQARAGALPDIVEDYLQALESLG